MDLTLDDHRVDADAAIVDRHHAADLDLAGATVNVDHDEIGPERKCHVGRIVVGHTLEAGLQPIGQVGVGGERHVLDGLGLRGRAADEELAVVELDIGLRGFEQVGRDLLRLVTQLARHHRRSRPADGGAATRVGAQPVRGVVGVALLDLDVGGGDP